MVTRRRLMPRLEARGRTRYITTDWKAVTASLLDSRFTRVKSPRSRQYLIRASKKFAHALKPKKITDLLFYRSLAEKRSFDSAPAVLKQTRARRRAWSFAFKRLPTRSGLALTRRAYALRRIQGALFSRKDTAGCTLRPRTLRSVLHYRTSADRTATITYRKATALAFDSVGPQYPYVKLQRAAKGAHRGLGSRKRLFRQSLSSK